MPYYGVACSSPPRWQIGHNIDLAARPNEFRNVLGADTDILFRSFFLGGLDWHLAGLSQLPLEPRLLDLAGERFPIIVCYFVQEEPCFSNCLFLWAFL